MINLLWTMACAEPAAESLEAAVDQAPTLGTTAVDTRPVDAAFALVSSTWNHLLCYEDAELNPTWGFDAREVARTGTLPTAARTLDLSHIRNTTREEVAAAVLSASEKSNPLVRFRLQEVAGCLAAIPTERLASNGASWEPVVPVLDRRIDVPEAHTYREIVANVGAGLRASGLNLLAADGWDTETPCFSAGGSRVARNVLADALSCLPRPLPYALRTDGETWVLRTPREY